MKLNTISMKQLREEFPAIKKRFEKGEKLLLIYRSKPLAWLEPVKQIKKRSKLQKA